MSLSEKSKCLDNTGDSVFPVDTCTSTSSLPFSENRVLVCATMIIVLFNTVESNRITVIVQYFQDRFIETPYNNKTAISNITSVREDIMNNAQKDASNLMMYNNIVVCVTSFITCLFAGSVSDFLGRKLLLLFSLSGSVMGLTLLCVIIRFDLHFQLTFLGSAVEGIMGYNSLPSLAVAAIITDITQNAWNTAVIYALITGIVAVYLSVWQIAVGYLIEAAGFFIPMLAYTCHVLVALLITIFLLPETLRINQRCTCSIRTCIKKTFSLYLFDGDKRRRMKFFTGLAIYLTFSFVVMSTITLETMFTMNKPMNWSSVEIGIFISVKVIVTGLAAVAVLKVCKNRLSFEVTGMICGISSAAGFVLESFADSTLLMYLSQFVGMLFMTLQPLSRTTLSQSVSPDDQGTLFSSLFCIEAAASLLSSTIFTAIYNATIETFRGAVFMIMAGMNLLIIALFGMLWRLRTTSPMACDYERCPSK